VAESLCAGTPVIATRTGGMPEQVRTEGGDAGIMLEPMCASCLGCQELVTYTETMYPMTRRLRRGEAYQKSKLPEWKRLGQLGRDHIIASYHIDNTIRKWDELIQTTLAKPSTYKPWRLTTI